MLSLGMSLRKLLSDMSRQCDRIRLQAFKTFLLLPCSCVAKIALLLAALAEELQAFNKHRLHGHLGHHA